MSYRVSFRASASRSLDKLPRDVQARILRRGAALADNPRPAGCVKLSGQDNLWRVRVGHYRIVYEIDDEAKAVIVAIVAHRRESYRDL